MVWLTPWNSGNHVFRRFRYPCIWGVPPPSNGQILIHLKRAWMGGTQNLELSPIGVA